MAADNDEVEEVPNECYICHEVKADKKDKLFHCSICKSQFAHEACVETGKRFTLYYSLKFEIRMSLRELKTQLI